MTKGVIDTGTASVTNGTKTVTFAGVSVSLFAQNDRFIQGGSVGVIDSVDAGAGTATLTQNWPGTTSSAALYTIVPGVSDEELATNTRTLMQYISGPLLTIAAMTGDDFPANGKFLMAQDGDWAPVASTGADEVVRKTSPILAGTIGGNLTFSGFMTSSGGMLLSQTGSTSDETGAPFSLGSTAVGKMLLAGGVNNSLGYSYIQSVVSGIGYSEFDLNPRGGVVRVGRSGAANTTRLLVYGTGAHVDETDADFVVGNPASTTGLQLYAGINDTSGVAYIGVVRPSYSYNPLVLNPNGSGATDAPVGIGTTPVAGCKLDVAGNIYFHTDNIYTLGGAANRANTIYAGTGTINTSDETEKQWRGALTSEELAAAKDIFSEIGGFKFLDAVAEKGDAARIHIGVRAQRIQQIMEGHGLVAEDYAFFCFDTWDASPAVPEITASKVDEYGNPLMNAAGETIYRVVQPAVPAVPAGQRYGIRPDELIYFLIAALNARMAALENKEAA